MKTLFQSVGISILIIFYSCSGIKTSVKGFWTIDRIEYRNQNVINDILSNILIFKSNKCSLPTYFEHHKIQSYEEGKWDISNEKGKYYLTIYTENEIFSGRHKVCFQKDYENKLIKMIISSESLFIECTKGLCNFDKENRSIDEYLCK